MTTGAFFLVGVEVGLIPEHGIGAGFNSSIGPLVYESLESGIAWATGRQPLAVSSDLRPILMVEGRIRERFSPEDSTYSPRINPHAHSGFPCDLDNVPECSLVEPEIVLTECVDDNIEAFVTKSLDVCLDVAKYSIPEIACRDQHDQLAYRVLPDIQPFLAGERIADIARSRK